MSKLKALVFDLDGTLVDQEGAERDALQALFEQDIKLDEAPSFHVFLRDWRNVADEYLQRFLDNKMSFDEQRIMRFQVLYQKYGQDCPRELAEGLHQAYAAHYRGKWRAFEDTVPALNALKQAGYRLAIITNGNGEQQRAKLTATGLDAWFENVIVSEDIKIAKPDPGIYRASEKALGLAPAELGYVGDREAVDVAGAKAAGWTPIWLDRKGMPDALSQDPTVLIASDLLELPKLLA